MPVEILVNKLIEAKKHYYNGIPIMSDSEFDNLEDELRELDPENAYFSIVGTNVKGGDAVKHNHSLLSCAKGKKPNDVIRWLEKIKYNDSLVMMAKLDGLTGCITYTNGEFSKMATRGDGREGTNISHLFKYLGLPKTIPYKDTIDIVGEIILPKNTLFETNKKPLRNIACGLVSRKDATDELRFLSFVAFNIFGFSGLCTFNERLDVASKIGFKVVYNKVVSKSEIEETYNNYVNLLRQEFEYETDGLVFQVNDLSQLERIDSFYVIDNYHHYNFALKPKSVSVETAIRRIEWGGSKLGNLIPVAIFDEVTILDRKITKASLSNYETVERLNLEVGDKIIVSLNNDVIPYIVKNETKEIYQ